MYSFFPPFRLPTRERENFRAAELTRQFARLPRILRVSAVATCCHSFFQQTNYALCLSIYPGIGDEPERTLLYVCAHKNPRRSSCNAYIRRARARDVEDTFIGISVMGIAHVNAPYMSFKEVMRIPRAPGPLRELCSLPLYLYILSYSGLSLSPFSARLFLIHINRAARPPSRQRLAPARVCVLASRGEKIK